MSKGKQLTAKSPRAYMSRQVDTKELLETFLIVCEGEKTEPLYFKSFRVPKDVIDVHGFGYNTVTLVEKAIELSQNEEYDQVWVVFDRDSFPAQHFNEAMSLAQKHTINVAYSNESFELWYLLHFNYCDTALGRKQYCGKLGQILRREYQKNDPAMYEMLERRQSDAIRNAKKLLKQYKPLIPERANPSTTVHLLVEELLRFAR